MLLIALTLAPVAGAAPPAADPASLFAGRSTGRGELDLIFRRAQPYIVHNVGRNAPDGVFLLDQDVRFEGAPPRMRSWRIRATGEGQYVFELTDATGPGEARVDDGRLMLRYPMRYGLRVRQVLVPSADGRSIANTGSIRWLGLIPVGVLRETITREP